MIPVRTSSLFRNRWITLVWAAGICWSAAEFADSRKAAEPGAQPVTKPQANAPSSETTPPEIGLEGVSPEVVERIVK